MVAPVSLLRVRDETGLNETDREIAAGSLGFSITLLGNVFPMSPSQIMTVESWFVD